MLSVLMTVYEGENAAFFRQSLRSISDQALRPDEIVLVKDGPLTAALEEVISEFSGKLPLVIVALPKVGLSLALRAGIEACQGELVARMDGDDISAPKRFVVQTQALRSHPDIDVVGGSIAEFMTDPEQPSSVRRLPRDHNQILSYAKYRNPVNHMSVMFRREAVLRAGNYRNSPGFEDWHLWNRMLLSGSRFLNLDEILVLARIGNGMVKRRAGVAYIKNELAFHRDMYKAKFLSLREMLFSLALRIPIRLAPVPLLQAVYFRLLRSPA